MHGRMTRHRNTDPVQSKLPPLAAETVIAGQRLRAATIAALVSVILLTMAWMQTASLFGRVFPWTVIPEGIVIGLAVRRWGRGFDWRFPVLAVVATLLAAYGGNFLIAADTSAQQLGTTLPNVVFNITNWTLDVYFAEVISPADHIFALYAAVLAAYFSRRRLSRREVLALRNHRNNGTTE